MRIVLCNVPVGRAVEFAEVLISERLAACVNVLPITSVYRWEGKVENEPEETMLIKTAVEKVAALSERLLALHPYELPEILVLDVDNARSLGPYVDWVRGQTT